MSSSLILQRFSSILENPEVLNNPQKYLGPNTEKVLEFWKKIENLTEEQWRVVNESDFDFFNENRLEWDKAADLAINTSKEVVAKHYAYHAGCAAHVVTNSIAAADWATLELIGGVENPTFLKMFDNL